MQATRTFQRTYRISIIIPELMYFVMLTHSAVNVHVNTGANWYPIKAVREGSIILRFETATSQKKSVEVIEELRAFQELSVFRDRNQRINYCEFLLI